MKLSIIKYFGIAILGVTALTGISGCSDDFERPPMIIPEATMKPNTTIAELKQQYWKTDRNYVESVGQKEDGSDVIISGRVISSDEAGNIYQNLVIRDESGEALTLAVKTSSSWKLYNSCRFGADIVVNLTGLKVGGYNGLFQVGDEGTYNDAPSMTFMSSDDFKSHMETNGLGDPSKVDTLEVTLDELATAKATPAGLQKWQSQLVRIKGVYFKEAGQPFADPSQNNTNRYVANASGRELLVRNSSHSNFASELLPQGYGDITGILSYFGTDWQMILIDAKGCQNFTGEPVVPAGDIFTATFASGLDNFTIDNLSLPSELDHVWSHDANYKCMKASAFVNNTSYPSKSLLVSPEIDLTAAKTPVLVFEHAVNKFPDLDFVKANCQVLARVAGTTEWTVLPGLTFPESQSWTFVSSGNVSLEQFAGKKVQIAFSYTSEDSKSGTWEVKNVAIR